MRGGTALFACLLGALITSLCPAAARAAPRIIDGHVADQGEYPAQGFLELSTSEGTYVCGGTLLSNRYFLTAAHCATQPDSTTPLAPSALHVTLGKADKNDFTSADRYSVAANQVDALFHYTGANHDVPDDDLALLTLATPAPPSLDPLRLVGGDETSLWAAGAAATVIGWGTTERGGLSDELLQATVPMQSDTTCASAWGSEVDGATMVCAGGGATDTCGGDSGGPLMVDDGGVLVLAGLTSWGADPCAEPNRPGVYARLGAPALNAWVRARVPMARATASDTSPEQGEPVTFTVTTTHPVAPAPFTGFAWDFDGDGITDATGATVSHAYPAAGTYVARVHATGSGADVATDKVAVHVASPPPPPVVTPPPLAPVVAPPVAAPRVAAATILVSGRPRVRRGRFRLRLSFARSAPRGIAVIQVFRGKRRIGGGRARVRRGGTRRVVLTLTPRGRRLLRRSATGRLRVRVQVRVNGLVLRSRTLTIRR
jgi:secreted trypsin-like serine protease